MRKFAAAVFNQSVELATGVPWWMLWAAILFTLVLAGIAAWRLVSVVRPLITARKT